MALNSVNTNVGAMAALQTLNGTNTELGVVQGRINTGKKIATAKDNGAIWAIAKNQAATSNSLNAVRDSLQRGQSTIDVGLAAGDTVVDLLNKMKEKALAAADTSITTASRETLAADFNSLRDQITKAVSNAKFSGANIIDGSTNSMSFLSNDSGDAFTVTARNLSLGGLGLDSDSTFTNASDAVDMVSTITTALSTATNKLASLGTNSAGLDAHLTFINKLQDSLDAGVGNLVDADLAKESARLTALQTKQQLGVQALSIANSSTSTVLGLFR
ncbi:flagellin [Caulobacter segnis]|uniref:flagellin n=1 Tax=Caulobacter segnis TaxID=88688 RepID=UPI00240ED2ED|nr:flagellin [Caulobacter segnis]MDG2522437.1 flagellin [Caulobacter segnis]